MDGMMVIYGEVPSKSNCYRIVERDGHGTLCKQARLEEYENAFYMQCSLRGRGISRLFRLDCDVYFTSMRHDLDNAFKIILDCLQMCGAIRNDNLCVAINARKFTDKRNPRIEYRITEVTGDGR